MLTTHEDTCWRGVARLVARSVQQCRAHKERSVDDSRTLLLARGFYNNVACGGTLKPLFVASIRALHLSDRNRNHVGTPLMRCIARHSALLRGLAIWWNFQMPTVMFFFRMFYLNLLAPSKRLWPCCFDLVRTALRQTWWARAAQVPGKLTSA